MLAVCSQPYPCEGMFRGVSGCLLCVASLILDEGMFGGVRGCLLCVLSLILVKECSEG